jgi:ribosomal protein S27E
MNNKERFELLLKDCWLTQTRAAEVIEEITQRPLSARAVRSWLTDQTKPSYRPCPDWAIEALQEYKRRPMVFDDEPAEPDVVAAINPDDQPIALGIPYTMKELMDAFEAAQAAPTKRRISKTQQEHENIRYRCPSCKMQVFGASGLMVGCITCDETLIPMHD